MQERELNGKKIVLKERSDSRKSHKWERQKTTKEVDENWEEGERFTH